MKKEHADLIKTYIFSSCGLEAVIITAIILYLLFG